MQTVLWYLQGSAMEDTPIAQMAAVALQPTSKHFPKQLVKQAGACSSSMETHGAASKLLGKALQCQR